MLELCRCPNIYGPDCIYIYIYIYKYILGWEDSPIRSVHRQKKVNDAMHWFKKCASDTSWHLYRDASFLTYFHR